MYNSLKIVVKKVIPKKFLLEHEDHFRKVLVPFYKGNKHVCNLCSTQLSNFVHLENRDLICPICGSLPRTRRLFMLLNNEFLQPNMVVLDFSPFRAVYRNLKKRNDFDYYPTDFETDFLADYHFDITKIETEDNKFDLIICYHVLEHIVNDQLAMKELHRVLKKNGNILIQTPFKEGEIYEDFTKTTQEERLQYFGQNDHVRIYSASGLENRLRNVGFQTEVRTLAADDYFGFSENERIIIAKKH